MRYIIPSLGRPEMQKTLESMTDEVLAKVELMVVPSEYKAYRKQWYSDKVKAIHAWPAHIDMMPKKRKWLALNAGDDYVMIDDDLMLYTWSKKLQKYVRAKDMPELFNRRMLEVLPRYYAQGNCMVSVPMKFMADMHVKEKGFEKPDDVGYVFTGFAKKKAKHVQFNKVFAFTDMSVPMQVLARHKKSMTYYGLCFSQSSAKQLMTTGSYLYRTNFLQVDSGLKMVQLFEGVVTNFKHTKDQGGGGITLEKRVRRLIEDNVQPHHIEKSRENVQIWLDKLHLTAPPKIWTYEDEQPRDDIIARMKREWNKVADKKGRVE